MQPLRVLGYTLLVLVTPILASAAPAPASDHAASDRWLRYAEVIGHGRSRTIYYYTNVVLTGSHIPVVIRRYRGHLEIVSGGMTQGVAYSVGDLAGTGAIDVGSELAKLDPAISLGGARR